MNRWEFYFCAVFAISFERLTKGFFISLTRAIQDLCNVFFLVHFVPCERARKDLIFSSEWNRVIIWYIIVIRGPSFRSVLFAYQLGNWSNVSRSWVKVSTFFIDRTFRGYNVIDRTGWFPCGVSLQNVCNSFRFIIETLLTQERYETYRDFRCEIFRRFCVLST